MRALLVGVCLFFSLQGQVAITLLIPLYNEFDAARALEYKTCLIKNIENNAIVRIHILYDTSSDAKSADRIFLQDLLALQAASEKPIVITEINRRQTFKNFFELANKLYPGQVVAVANADIYFDETLNFLDGYNLTKKFIALTRWEPYPGSGAIWKQFYLEGPLRSDSQDVWIFKTPIHIKRANIKMGAIACDPNIAFEAHDSGYQVIDACLTIKAWHLHNVPVRHYNPYAKFNYKRFKMLLLTTLY